MHDNYVLLALYSSLCRDVISMLTSTVSIILASLVIKKLGRMAMLVTCYHTCPVASLGRCACSGDIHGSSVTVPTNLCSLQCKHAMATVALL